MILDMLYIISAPSGSGKSSLIKALLKKRTFYDTQVAISHTTRDMRPGERHGQHYFFISVAEFEKMISERAFLEHAKIFGNYYGTARQTIKQVFEIDVTTLLDIDWQGAQQIRRNAPNVCSIFILPPSKKELDRRLRSRGQDSEEIITQRMIQAVSEIIHYDEYDYLIINDNFNAALNDLKTIIQCERLRVNRQKLRHDTLIRTLLAD
ncbi:guanylate kinase [Candidatus Curculioniphilus buchneri]|uniref:guanylate kinase n=1 Tax=Candidatus Curculioniphilus buchneri TaxID=690594 RepID=UPI00376EC910